MIPRLRQDQRQARKSVCHASPPNGVSTDIQPIQGDEGVSMRFIACVFALWASAFAVFASESELDTTFGVSGKVTLLYDVGGSFTDRIVKILRYPDNFGGKYVAVGTASIGGGAIGIALARFNASGSLDTTFGINGKVVKDACMSEVTHAAFDSNFRIVVVGTSPCSGNATTDVGVIRFTATGADDTAFAGDGGLALKYTPDFDGNDNGGAVLVLSDDSLLIGGSKNNAAWIQRVSSTGVVSALPAVQTGAVAFPIRVVDVLPGQANSSFWLLEEVGQTSNTPGSIWKINNATLGDDTTFAPNGLVTILVSASSGSCGSGGDHVLSSLVRIATRIYAFGFTDGASGGETFMWGTGENTGSNRFYRCLESGGNRVNMTTLAAVPSSDAGGSVYLAGSSGSPENFALMRVVHTDAGLTSFTPDPTFNGGVPVTVAFSHGAGQQPQSEAFSLVRHGNKSVLAGLRVFNFASGDFDFAMARFGTDPPDVFANGFE